MMKIIRDKVPERMRARGYEPNLRQAEGEEAWQLLLLKLEEETSELVDKAIGAEQIVEELADVIEVVEALKRQAEERWPGELKKTQAWKNEEKGTFTKLYVWDGP